ncbi:S-layer homology domain-containing protein [Tumidithrix elongata RA019]|uniref:S-layer homology domain-containing protein n=1 Tax=Tumidithrix elongata BACA0141 TaxID=2716417 RepID=A0AAW9PU77_9CYAN|nr:S-layer homology domain-containing protein [Tumidithrix elongata RA019]
MAKYQTAAGLLLLLTLGSYQSAIAAVDRGANTSTSSNLPFQIAQANTILFVAPSGTDALGAGTQATPFRSITAALNAKPQAGTIVQIAPGTYSADTGEIFPLKIPAGVTLRGDSSSRGAGVLISGGGTFVSPTFARQNVSMLVGNGTTVEGITLTNSGNRGYALWVESAKNVAIANNTFVGTGHDGVFLTGDTSANVVGNIFTKNGANGLSAVGTSSGEIRENTFEDTGFGLAIGQRSRVALIGNRITKNRGGIVISNIATPTLRGNLIENNTENGLVVLKDRNSQPTVDLGTTGSLGQNIFRGNKVADINNASGVTIAAVGNQVDLKRVIGPVDLVASSVPITPPQTPSPVVPVPPTPKPPVNPPTSPVNPPTVSSGLSDVKGHWAEKYITALAEKGIIKGFNDGKFRPEDSVTRAQFAAIVNSAFPTKQNIRPSVTFKDVPTNFWANQAIQEANAKGFISGYPNQTFRPTENITRAQVLVALVNGWQLSGGNPNSLPSLYQDAAQIPSYALGAIATATNNKLVVNYPSPKLLAPNRNATRAEVAAIIYQTLAKQGAVPAIPSAFVTGQ